MNNPKFKAGDKVRIVNNTTHGFRTGKEDLTVLGCSGEEHTGEGVFHVYRVHGRENGYGMTLNHYERDLELMSGPETKPSKIEVDADFIKEAHAAACSEWQEKLEEKFPQVFENPRLTLKLTDTDTHTIRNFQIGDTGVQLAIGSGMVDKEYKERCLMLLGDRAKKEYEFKIETSPLHGGRQVVVIVPRQK
jgi:hypothetical protein